MEYLQTVTFYMEPELCQSAREGRHNFIGKVANVLKGAGFQVEYAAFGLRQAAGRSISHIKAPQDANGLCFRRAYHYPFWQIEQSAERWAWDIAQAPFSPKPEDAKQAAWFYSFWRNRLFGQTAADAARGGFVYVPLQGKLLDHRPFQICSPMEMIEHTLAQTTAPVIAALHPQEKYSKAELAALDNLEKAHSRLRVQTGGMEDLLTGCDYVVTQNSSVAFNGYFFGKPALLFRKAEFHHIAIQAKRDDLAESFAAVQNLTPDYAAYLHWFWQKNSINAGRPEAEDMIAARLRRFDWPIP